MAGLDLLSTVVEKTIARGEPKAVPSLSEKRRVVQQKHTSKDKQKRVVAKVGSAVKPKRPLTAYNFFFQHERAKLLGIDPPESNKTPEVRKKRKHRKTHGKYGFTEMSRIISQKWSKIDDDTRKIYVKKQDEDAKRYKDELSVYKKSLDDQSKEEDRKKELFARDASSVNFSAAPRNLAEFYAASMGTLQLPLHSESSMAAVGNVNLNSYIQGTVPSQVSRDTQVDMLRRQALVMQLTRSPVDQIHSDVFSSRTMTGSGYGMMGQSDMIDHTRRQSFLRNLNGMNDLAAIQSINTQRLFQQVRKWPERQIVPSKMPGI